jgi:hypothetical protein
MGSAHPPQKKGLLLNLWGNLDWMPPPGGNWGWPQAGAAALETPIAAGSGFLLHGWRQRFRSPGWLPGWPGKRPVVLLSGILLQNEKKDKFLSTKTRQEQDKNKTRNKLILMTTPDNPQTTPKTISRQTGKQAIAI